MDGSGLVILRIGCWIKWELVHRAGPTQLNSDKDLQQNAYLAVIDTILDLTADHVDTQPPLRSLGPLT